MAKNMKKNIKKTPAPVIAGIPSFRPCKTLSEVTRDWFNKAQAKASPENVFIQDFFTVATMLCQNYKTFNFRDVIGLTRALDTPTAALAPMFNSWVDDLLVNDRVTCLNLFGDPEYTFK